MFKEDTVDGNMNAPDENMNATDENMNAVDENMNAVDENVSEVTFAGETSPPTSGDKRLVGLIEITKT